MHMSHVHVALYSVYGYTGRKRQAFPLHASILTHIPAVGQPPGGALGHLIAARVGARADVAVVGEAHGEATAERVHLCGRNSRQHDAELD